MNAGLAPDPSLDSSAASAGRLVALPSVHDARRVAGGWLVVPSEAGIRRLRRAGRAELLAEWQPVVGYDGTGRWRILEALPAPHSRDEQRLLESLREPWVDGSESLGPGAARFQLRVPLDLDVFDGHFTGIPIVPAVIQIGWVMQLLRRGLRPEATFAGLHAAKFRRLVRPAMALTLSVHLESGCARFEFCTQGAPVSSGRILLGPSDG